MNVNIVPNVLLPMIIVIRYQQTDTGEKLFKCQFCTKPFIDNYSLKIYQRELIGEKPYQCHFCNKSFIKQLFNFMNLFPLIKVEYYDQN